MTHKLENIINAAGELFMTRPYHMVTMEDVRKGAGVGKGTLYRHFESKEELYCSVVQNELDRLVESIVEYADGPGDGDPRLRVRALSSKLAGFFENKKPLFALMRSEELRGTQAKKKLFKQWKHGRDCLVEVFEKAIDEGMACGVYRRDVPARVAAAFLIAVIKSASRDPARGEQPLAGKGDRIEYALSIFDRGMAAEGERPQESGF